MSDHRSGSSGHYTEARATGQSGFSDWQTRPARLTCRHPATAIRRFVVLPSLRTSLPITFLALLTGGHALADDLFLDDPALPQVLTATRLKQAAAAVPGSMTVLDRQLIDASGARDIPELLRLVPGMLVGYRNGNQATVNYHGTNATEARRLQVLVDGRSQYRPGLATVDWSDIPVAIEDIERIEVFRGPNTVSYGANALMGVINIITRAPADSDGTRLKYTQGQRDIRDWYASQGFGQGGHDLRLSLSGQQDDGFDHDEIGQDYRDGRRLSRFNLSASHALATDQTLDWQLAAKEGSKQRPNSYRPVFAGIPNGSDNADIEARDYAASLRWTFDASPDHSLYVQGYAQQWERLQEWRPCEATIAFSPQLGALWQIDPGYVEALTANIRRGVFSPPSGTAQQQGLATQVLQQLAGPGQQPVCGYIDQNTRETRYDLELQDTLSLSDRLRLVSGVNYRYDRAVSETYLGGRINNEVWRLFGHLEWRMSEHWLLQGGAMLESDQLSGSSLSPRLAANYLITPRHGLRAVYSEAVRSPDMFEDNADWSYRLQSPSPPLQNDRYFARAQGSGTLDREIMRSRELGYNGQFETPDLNVDIKLFHDEITRMISEPLRLVDFTPSNGNRISFDGAETQLDWRLGRQDRLRLTYAYIEFDASHRLDQRLTPRHSGSAGWLRDWGRGWSSALFYYGADQLNEYRFERVDLRVAKRLALGRADLELSGVLQQRLDDEPLTWRENRYADRHLLYFSAELAF